MRKSPLLTMLILLLSAMLTVGCSSSPANNAPAAETDAVEQGNADIVVPDENPLTFTNPYNSDGQSSSDAAVPISDVTFEGVAYMMVYNPLLYSEHTRLSNARYSGAIGEQLDEYASRADDEEEPVSIPTTIPQNAWDAVDVSAIDPHSGTRAEEPRIFAVGDSYQFYQMDMNGAELYPNDFTCLHASKNCNIWVNGDTMTVAEAEAIANELDSRIYDIEVEQFGSGRFIDGDAKLNILIYEMPEMLGGFFCPAQLFTYEEAYSADLLPTTTDAAIIHVNSLCLTKDNQSLAFVTVAHEFQHLINFTQTMRNYTRTNGEVFLNMDAWLNESMSMYAEDDCYDGSVVEMGYIRGAYNRSPFICNGGSLYNFAVPNNDVGVYGQGYIFSQYLLTQNGRDVFSRLHAFWNGSTGDAPYSVSGALKQSCTPEFASEVDESVTYSDALTGVIGDAADIWLSKLALNFHIACFTNDSSGLYALGSDCDETNPKCFGVTAGSDIEGGGRLLLALANDEYAVPGDADPNLIYVGFDADRNIVIPPTTAAEYAS